MVKRLCWCALLALALLACGRDDDPNRAVADGSRPSEGPVGTRCDVAGDCDQGLSCFGRFAGERPVCTRPCTGTCPAGSECVSGVPDYNDGTAGDYCLHPCQTSADCDGLGSECDSETADGKRYCY